MHGAAYNELGYAYTRLDKKDSALHCLGCAIYFNPGNPKSYVNKTLLLLNAGRYDEALFLLDEPARQIPSFDATTVLKG